MMRSAMAVKEFSDYKLIQPIMNCLVQEINGDDLLSCITALEVLSDIASSSKENARYLNKIGLLDQTYNMLIRSQHNPDGGLIHSGKHLFNFNPGSIKLLACIRFFGHLSVSSPDSLERFPLFTQEIFDMINHFDQVDFCYNNFINLNRIFVCLFVNRLILSEGN